MRQYRHTEGYRPEAHEDSVCFALCNPDLATERVSDAEISFQCDDAQVKDGIGTQEYAQERRYLAPCTTCEERIKQYSFIVSKY